MTANMMAHPFILKINNTLQSLTEREHNGKSMFLSVLLRPSYTPRLRSVLWELKGTPGFSYVLYNTLPAWPFRKRAGATNVATALLMVPVCPCGYRWAFISNRHPSGHFSSSPEGTIGSSKLSLLSCSFKCHIPQLISAHLLSYYPA